MRDFAENPQHAVLGVVDDLDDTAAVANFVIFFGFLNSEEDAVANTGSFSGPYLARQMNTDFWRGAMRFLVPFVRSSQ